MIVTCVIKIHDVLFLKKWQPWKGPVLAEIVELFLPGSCSAFCGPASSQCLASLAQSAYVSVGVRFCRTIRARHLQKAASLSSWLFTCHSMRHSECCKVMSESVVSVTIQLTSQVLHCSWSINSSGLHDATLVASVVDQILLQMLGAEQMCRGIEDVKIHISELQCWNILELQYN